MNIMPIRCRTAVRAAAVTLIAACASGVSSASTNAPSSSSSSSSSSTPPASAYIEQPQTGITTVTSTYSPSYYSGYYGGSYWGGSYGSGFYSGYYPSGYSTSFSYIPPRRYFFPPKAPALGEPFPKNRTKSASTSRSTIPLSLAEYVNEPFYAPLSPFLYEENISKRRQKMIDDYMAAKQTLIAELRAKIASLQNVDAATRESQLADFARNQTQRVMEVEKIAYDIRDELTHWRLFSDSSDWNEGREWRLGDDTRWESTLDDAKVMRGAAYFQDGLSPAQRRLLREYAMELDDSGRSPTTDVALDARGPYLYFSPETSRVRLPANIPADLQGKISNYVRQKSVLKKEIRDVLYREDRRFLNSRRTAALRELADRQAPQIAALEPLAEEIRRGLMLLPNPSRPRPVAQVLPSTLADRVAAFMDRKTEFQTTLNNRLAELRRQFPTSRVEFVKMNDGYGIQVTANRKLKAEDVARVQAASEQLAKFNEDEIRVYNELVREKEAIRDELIKSAGNLGPMMSSRIVDLILREYGTTLAVQELWRQFDDYETAVLQPGLSPEQRRLLYDAALVKLDQQIPYYTY